MKRKVAWLALPFVLVALILGVKWRAEHLAMTRRVQDVRGLMLKYPVEVTIGYRNSTKFRLYQSKLSKDELKPYIEIFQVLPKQNRIKGVDMSGDSAVRIDCRLPKTREDGVIGAVVYLNVDKRQGASSVYRLGKGNAYNLHPITINRWIALLLANPRIGPELKARLK